MGNLRSIVQLYFPMVVVLTGCLSAPRFESLTPEPLWPKNGAAFDSFPRTTELSWRDVPGAVSYSIQVDCFHCCDVGKWCTELGKPLLEANGLLKPQYSFVWGGANLGRWRVWAVAADGTASNPTAWQEFLYTR
jgi:hypothetical protein